MSNPIPTPYRSMTTEQRVKYNTEFMRWYANRSQITDCVAQQHALDADANRAFDEGVQLLQAWPFGVKFLDSVSCLPKARCADRLMYLTDLAKKQMGVTINNLSQSKQSEKKENSITPPSTPRENNHTHGVNGDNGASEIKNSSDSTHSMSENTPIIPESGKLHLDQISYLLSPQLAERVKNLKQILDTRDAESNIAKQLAADGKSQQEIAPHSEAAVKAQEEATAIYERVDDELAELVATYRYIRTHKAEPGQQETAFKTALSNLEEAAKPFGTLDRLIAALTPYYEKCNKDGRIDRMIMEKVEGKSEKSESAGDNSSAFCGAKALTPHSSLEPEDPAYDAKDYKRIWTYVSRQDVAHTEKRLRKMRECIDDAIAAGMPNIEAMETFYQKEAEMVLAEQEKRLNDGEPSLL